MGNSQKNDQKLISTIWLGVNDDWPCIMKEKLSRISEEWSVPLFKCLQRFSCKEQNKFKKQIKLIISKKMKEEQYDELFQQSQEFLIKNEYLRQDIQSNLGIIDITISTSFNSCKINETQSISSKLMDSQFIEEQNQQVQQFYMIFSCINDAIRSQKHPFIHIMKSFQDWINTQLNKINNPQNNIHNIKLKLRQFQMSSDLFFNFLIFSLNEYLGDFGEDNIDDGLNKYIKDKQNYYNLFLYHIYDETLIDNLMLIIKSIHNNNNNTFLQKIKNLRSKLEFFEIPKKYLGVEEPFQQEISCLNRVNQLKNPSEIFYCFTKTYMIIKEHLAKSASNFLFFQVTNYVIVHSNIENLHAILHLLDIFFSNAPVLIKFNQSQEFIQNIIIS